MSVFSDSTITPTELRVVLWLSIHPDSTAREVARFLWPDSPAWERRTKMHRGRNGSMGGTMPMKAGRILWGLSAKGHVEQYKNSLGTYVWRERER